MPIAESWLLAGLNFSIGLLVGSVLYRGDFCIAGILRDQFLFRDRTLLRPLLLCLTLTMLLFTLARYAGVLSPLPPATYGAASLMDLAGGWLFGIGMVLAGGCVFSTLYKMAGGNLSHGVAFCGIVAGSLLYGDMHPHLEQARQMADLSGEILLRQHWPVLSEYITWLLIGTGALFALKWRRNGSLVITAAANGYLQPWKVAVWLALANLAAYLVNGWPIGISTAYLKIGLWLDTLLLPDHAARISRQLQVPGVMVDYRAIHGMDLFFLTELTLMAGIVIGAMAAALVLKEFRIYGLPPLPQAVMAFVGGIMIAVGARLAHGCNVKLMLGGLPLLSLKSVLFVCGMLLGAWLGSWLLPKIIFRSKP